MTYFHKLLDFIVELENAVSIQECEESQKLGLLQQIYREMQYESTEAPQVE